MNDKHCFSDRESILAIEYFKDKNLEVFKGIYKEMKIDVFSKKVKNISWDLMAPRIMEDFIKGMTFEKDVFIPFLFLMILTLEEL
ncbi:hypothetical protein ES754_01865 [Psychrobacter frigidicola]|uniref:Uncharacterized protein n=1 Tax=Psychrobacter frigidicola TaxID=45611 RepID=A0A5C7A3T8_9GAMM|nr:hypothetical protein [Psychrobacter frigidicola]TXD97748.1 hypothetical protein ES754_01865 [Psychrobacter frigidicola]